MAHFTYAYRVDLQKPIQTIQLPTLMFTEDHLSVELVAHVFDGQEEADLTGGDAIAYVVRPDGTTVPVHGSASGNTARVTLTEACFNSPGRIAVSLRLTQGSGESIEKTVLLHLSATVVESKTPIEVDPGGEIELDLDALFQRLDTLIDGLDTLTVNCQDATNQALAAAQHAVLYDEAQTLEDSQQTQARMNIAAPSVDILAATHKVQTPFVTTSPSVEFGVTANGLYTATGKELKNNKRAKTRFFAITPGTTYAVTLSDPEYIFRIGWQYSSASLNSGIVYIPDKSTSAIVFKAASNAAYACISFSHADDTIVMTEDDFTAITSALTLSVVTDSTLTAAGAPADAKATGDAIRQEVEERTEAIRGAVRLEEYNSELGLIDYNIVDSHRDADSTYTYSATQYGTRITLDGIANGETVMRMLVSGGIYRLADAPHKYLAVIAEHFTLLNPEHDYALRTRRISGTATGATDYDFHLWPYTASTGATIGSTVQFSDDGLASEHILNHEDIPEDGKVCLVCRCDTGTVFDNAVYEVTVEDLSLRNEAGSREYQTSLSLTHGPRAAASIVSGGAIMDTYGADYIGNVGHLGIRKFGNRAILNGTYDLSGYKMTTISMDFPVYTGTSPTYANIRESRILLKANHAYRLYFHVLSGYSHNVGGNATQLRFFRQSVGSTDAPASASWNSDIGLAMANLRYPVTKDTEITAGKQYYSAALASYTDQGVPVAFNTEAETSAHDYGEGDLFVIGTTLYKATAAISTGDALDPDENCVATTPAAELIREFAGESAYPLVLWSGENDGTSYRYDVDTYVSFGFYLRAPHVFENAVFEWGVVDVSEELNIATSDELTATTAHSAGDLLRANGGLFLLRDAVAKGDAIVKGDNAFQLRISDVLAWLKKACMSPLARLIFPGVAEIENNANASNKRSESVFYNTLYSLGHNLTGSTFRAVLMTTSRPVDLLQPINENMVFKQEYFVHFDPVTAADQKLILRFKRYLGANGAASNPPLLFVGTYDPTTYEVKGNLSVIYGKLAAGREITGLGCLEEAMGISECLANGNICIMVVFRRPTHTLDITFDISIVDTEREPNAIPEETFTSLDKFVQVESEE